jgi:hypothetical protein
MVRSDLPGPWKRFRAIRRDALGKQSPSRRRTLFIIKGPDGRRVSRNWQVGTYFYESISNNFIKKRRGRKVPMDRPDRSHQLNLRVGDVVEVRSAEEILATLDENGALEALPFMPEMLVYCGKQFPVYRTMHKVCDTIIRDGIREMPNTVLLEGLRCDGEAHGGCQAECMLFWKEAWLKRVSAGKAINGILAGDTSPRSSCTQEGLYAKTRQSPASTPLEDVVYSCQATEMRNATTPLSGWKLDQYVQDVRSGNVGIFTLLKGLFIWMFNEIQGYRKGGHYPFIEGKLQKTPAVKLDLQPGQLVRVLPKNEILQTLDVKNRNRGLTFDREMVRYCGGTYRVRRRIDKLLNEKTGKMMNITADCIILEEAICTGELNRFCPRAVFPCWKETWLQKVE